MRFTDPLGLWPTYRGAMSLIARTAGAVSISAVFLGAITSETIVGGIAFGTIAMAAGAVSAAAYESIAVYDCAHHTNPKGSCARELAIAGLGVATALYGGSALSGSAEEALNDPSKPPTPTKAPSAAKQDTSREAPHPKQSRALGRFRLVWEPHLELSFWPESSNSMSTAQRRGKSSTVWTKT